MNDIPDRILMLVLAIPAFVMAMTLHEFAHAWTADKLGDDTPRRMGRVTLDPMAHLDPMGTMMFVISALVGFGIGWAKPVPFVARNLKDPRRDTVLIALAGPVSNLVQCLGWLILLWLFSIASHPYLFQMGDDPQTFLKYGKIILEEGVLLNMLLAVFNMIPIPPLDGHYVLQGLGPPAVAEFYRSIQAYTPILFIMLVAFPNGALTHLLEPFYNLAFRAIAIATGAYDQ